MQEEVQEGHRPGLRDPIQVAHEFLENYLNLKGKRSQPIQTLDDGKKIITFNLDNGKMIELRLIQPLGNDKRGIWAVEAYRYIN
ncbi:MAG: hypothetical protein PWQ97_1271 [Tepidanaerobacteraceae bacterium]|nr:hypothetical protein [Tepidanaerobacteraceae bacterium]